MEEPIGAEPIAHLVGETRQLDAMDAHDAHAAELETFSQIEHGLAVLQNRKRGVRSPDRV